MVLRAWHARGEVVVYQLRPAQPFEGAVEGGEFQSHLPFLGAHAGGFQAQYFFAQVHVPSSKKKRARRSPRARAIHLATNASDYCPRISPNRTHSLPSNFASCSDSMGAKSVGLVLILMPGRRTLISKFFRFAACFITFSCVRLSPHCLSTWISVCAAP